jgi:hypothetical protein
MLAVRDAGTRADTAARPAQVLDGVLQAQVFIFSRGFGRMQGDGQLAHLIGKHGTEP